MISTPQTKSDGIVDFSGGMDSNTSPSTLQKNQYFCAVNMRLESGKRGISTRQGYREVRLNFKSKKEESMYRNSVIQGCGYYLYGNIIIQLVSCDGYIFELEEVNKWEYNAKYLGFRNNPTRGKCYVSNIPDGAMIDDGESRSIYAKERSYRRTTRNEIEANYGGKFIQNRYFYKKQDGFSVGVSSFNQPTSTEESRFNNFSGFQIPDNNIISALGEQRSLNRDSQGGSLVISSNLNIYSVDVRGPMSGWGNITANSSVGVVSGDIYDIGAQSQYSFLSLNGNVYFRSRSLGLVSVQYLQYIFNNQDILESQSRGGDLFFNNDDQFLLDRCYTVKYKNKLYTTVAPDMLGVGVYWSGMLVCKPQQKGLITYESLYTGVRPWCLCQPDDIHGEEFLYIHSYDCDGVNRMYILDESSDMDYVIGKKPKEIESKLFTRMMSFDNGFAVKKPNGQSYSISEMPRDVSICIKTRSTDGSSFEKIYETIHKSNIASVDEGGIPVNINFAKGQRDPVPFGDKQTAFVYKQDVIRLLGSANLQSIIRQAYLSPQEKTTHIAEKSVNKELYEPEKFFSYKTIE